MTRYQQPTLYVSATPRCVSGWKPLAVIPDASDVRERWSLDLDEWCSFVIPAESASLASLTPRAVLGVVKASGTAAGAYHEYRIAEITRVSTTGERSVRVVARSVLLDLADCGPLLYPSPPGAMSYSFAAELTPEQWIDTYILPHLTLAGVTHFAKGTISPTETLGVLSFENWTPLQLLQELAKRTLSELYIERNGTTNYTIHLVTTYTGAGRTARVMNGRQLLRHVKRTDTSQQATVLYPSGGLGTSDRQRSIAGLLWRVSAVDTGNNKLTLGHPDGSTACYPIIEDDEWNGYRLFRFPLGVTDVVLDSWGGTTQQVSLTNVAAGGWTVGDLVMVRENAGESRAYRVPNSTSPDTALRVTAIATNALTMKEMGGGSTTFVTTDLFKDLMLRGAPLQHNTTVSTSVAPDTYTIASTANIAVGDVGFVHSNAAEPYSLYAGYYPFRVIEIVSGTEFRVETLYRDGDAVAGAGAASKYIRFYRPRAGATRCVSCTATGTITGYDVAAAGIASSDMLLVEAEGGYRERVALKSPSSIALYSVKGVQVARGDRSGNVNALMHNDPSFEVWSSGTTMTYWTIISGTFAQIANSNALSGGIYGSWAARCTGTGSFTSLAPVYINPGSGETTFTIRVRFKTPSGWTATNGAYVSVTCFGQKHTFYSPATTSPPSSDSITEISGDLTWFDADCPIALHGMAATPSWYYLGGYGTTAAPRGVVNIAMTTGVIVDMIHVANDSVPPDAMELYGSAYRLVADARSYLLLYKNPPTVYELSAADLARMDPNMGHEEIDLGTTLAIVDSTLDEATTLRVVAVEQSHDNPADTQLTVNSLRDTLTKLLAGV